MMATRQRAVDALKLAMVLILAGGYLVCFVLSFAVNLVLLPVTSHREVVESFAKNMKEKGW